MSRTGLLSLTRLWPSVTIIPRRGNIRGSIVPASVTEKDQKSKPVKPMATTPRDEPAYIKYTDEQIHWFWKEQIRTQGAVWPREMDTDKYPIPEKIKRNLQDVQRVDPESEPFRRIYEGNESDDFSPAEIVSDPNVWFWVQRVLPDNPVRDLPRTDCRDRMPSGWIPPPITPPDRTYFVRRLRNGLYPVFKELVNRDHTKTLLVTDHKFDPHPDVLTLVLEVDGEIRDLEQELVDHIQSIKKKKVLSAVSEFEGKITFKGDHVELIVKWLEDNGF